MLQHQAFVKQHLAIEQSETFLEMMRSSTSFNRSIGLYHKDSPYSQDIKMYQSYPSNSTMDQVAEKDDWLLVVEVVNLYEPLFNSLMQSILKLRFLFYLVWPTETMFSSLKEVPRYVAEVSA